MEQLPESVIKTVIQQRTLRLMTYNMQVGIRTQSYRDYLRHSWRHLLPPTIGSDHLLPIADMLRDQDLVAIQEADAGSLRTRSINLLKYLADRAEFPYWHLHGHRNLAPLARHGMGLLSRYAVRDCETHALPGRIKGRAAVIYRLGEGASPLTLIVTHLALSRSDRSRQLSHIRDLVQDDSRLVLMGDLNCEPQELQQHPFYREREFQTPEDILHSHPSWRPRRQIDHILATPNLEVTATGVTAFPWSDHLPVTMEITLPTDLELKPA